MFTTQIFPPLYKLRSKVSKIREAIMSGVEQNWQTSRDTIRKRSKFMFNNELLSDVSFVVRESISGNDVKKAKRVIPVHKFILAMGSPVFFAMFFGELAETADSIELPDCEYASLLELFRYMYCDEVNLDPNNVMQVLYLANKYIVPYLAEKCVEYLGNKVDASNAFYIISHAQNHENTKLVNECWNVIDSQTIDAVKSDAFFTIDRALLESFAGRDSLNIPELELFKAIDCWATKTCQRKGLKAIGTIKRRVLGDEIVKRIRFPVMEQKEFVSFVLRTKILKPREAFDMVEYFHSILSTPIGFSEAKRGTVHQRCSRFRAFVLEVTPYHSNSADRIIFSVDNDVVLHGVCLFGSQKNEYPATVETGKIGIGEILAAKTGKFSSVLMQCKEGSFYGFDVLFDYPVSLQKGQWYYMKASVSGPVIWYGANGLHSVQCPGVRFRFRNSKKNRETTVQQGQLPQFVFSLG